MTTQIKYTTNYGVEVSMAQMQGLNSFTKQYIIDKILFKEEIYKENQLIGTLFYVSSQLQIQNILQTDPNARFKYKYEQSGYVVLNHLVYKNNVLSEKIISVNDESNNTICYQKNNLPGITPNYLTTEKYYYDETGEVKYKFEYRADGNCLMIYDEQIDQADVFPNTIGNPDQSFSWIGFEYYEFAEPLVPNN